jgi:hypothetical protein
MIQLLDKVSKYPYADPVYMQLGYVRPVIYVTVWPSATSQTLISITTLRKLYILKNEKKK